MNNPEYVVFLGAGASCSEGAPTQSEIFFRAFTLKLHSKRDPSNHLKKYFKYFWGIDVDSRSLDKIVFPTFEEALGMLELAKIRGEAFKGYYSTANNNQIAHTIEDLIYLIAETLKHTLKRNIYHARLVSNVIESVLLKCCFVSLNYDILMDNALISIADKCDIDYGVDFINFTQIGNEEDKWKRPIPERAVGLLKIHGSLNWLYCPVCNQIKITPQEKGVTYIERNAEGRIYKCDTCRGAFTPILIPPTYYKNMSNYFISSIWHKAELALMSCKKIIFCGYSLPDADMHIKYLLKRGVLNRKKEQPEIIVINGHRKKKDEEKKAEKLRYVRLFGDSIDYSNYSFEEFAEKPDLYLK